MKGLKRPKGFEGESEGMWEGEEKRVEDASESRLRWESFARWGGVEEAGEESKMSRWRLRDVRIVCLLLREIDCDKYKKKWQEDGWMEERRWDGCVVWVEGRGGEEAQGSQR